MNNLLCKLTSLLASIQGTNRRSPARKALSQFTLESLETRTLLAATLVKDINSLPIPLGSDSRDTTDVNGIAYFTANDGTHGFELWKSDGTAAGTVMVKDIRTGSVDASPSDLTNVNGTLYFTADDGVNGEELWKSNGTAAGTVMVKDIRTGSVDASPCDLTNVNGTLYFTANDGTNGYELWKSNGTAVGTVMVKDILSGSGSGSGIPLFLVA